MITLRTLGECVVEVDGTPYGPDADTAFAALVYLAAERGRHLSRQQFADLLWPGTAPPRARHSLRQLLYRLRAMDVPVAATRERIWFPEDVVAPTFSAEPTLARLRAARAQGTLVVGPYLPGYAPTFSRAFAEWLDGYRSVVEAQVRKALLDAADEHRLRGEWAERDALAREVLRLDPLNQAATMARAECAAMTGAVTEAVAILERYESELGPEHAELVRPTVALRRQIAEHFPPRQYRIPSDRCFVGRETLMSALTVALLRARNREGSAVLLWGPPGIGKTRLATELTSLAIVQGLRTVQVQGEESDARQPMAAFVDAVPQLLRLPGALGVSPDAMPFLRRLTEFDPTLREPSPEARDPQYLAGRIRQAIVDLVDAVAGEGPLLLLFEDVHWLDAASWTTLRTLIEWNVGKRVLILLTSRRPHATATPPQREVARLDVRAVGALDEAASAALVRAIAEDYGRPLPEGAEEWCGAVGEGNPLFLRELAVHCLEGGEPRAVPPSVQTLLDARIARLRPAAKRVLQAAAVLGEQSTVDRLDRVLELPAHDLLGALDELAEAGLVASAGTIVLPRHTLVSARVAVVTSEASRRLLHRRAAVVLEAEVSEGAPTDLMWACAEHWRSSGESSRAPQLAFSVANQLIEIGDPTAALTIYDRAAVLCSARTDELELQRRRATALTLSGRWADALDLLRPLVEQGSHSVPLEVWARDMVLAIEAHARLNGMDAESARASCQLAGDLRVPVDIRLDAATLALRIAANVGDSATAEDTWQGVRDIDLGLGSDPVKELHLAMLYHMTFGDLAQGSAAADRIRRLTERDSDSSYAAITLLLNLAFAERIRGNLNAAAQLATDAFGRATRRDTPYLCVRSAEVLARIALEREDADEAARWHHEAWQRAPDFPDQHGTIALQELDASIHLLRGDYTAAYVSALTALDAYRRLFPQNDQMLGTCVITAVQASLACTVGPIDPEIVAEVVRLHYKLRNSVLHDRGLPPLCEALVRQGAVERAANIQNEYLAVHRRGSALPPEPLLNLQHQLNRMRNLGRE